MALIPKANLVRASQLMVISVVIGLIFFLVYLFLGLTPASVTTFIVGTVSLLILAYFVRAGFEWARYLFVMWGWSCCVVLTSNGDAAGR